MRDEYTTDAAETQEDEPILLKDTSSTGKERPWAEHHKGSLALAALYDYMADPSGDGNKTSPQAAYYLALSQRLMTCAPWAVFERTPDGMRLQSSSFCRVRLCPMCQWRRSLKLAGQARMVVAEADRRRAIDTRSGQGWRWMMLTLTVRNVPSDHLAQEIDALHKALKRLTLRKVWPAAGWLRATEITYNHKADTYHPHMHLLLAVPPEYFAGRAYLSKAKWVQLWRDVAKLDYDPVLDIRVVKPKPGSDGLGAALAEVAKYGAKPSDYIRPQDIDLSAKVIGALTQYLDGRRLTSWGGVLKEAAAALRLDDIESGNLIHITDEQSGDDAANIIHDYILYKWSVGWGDYAQADMMTDIPAWARNGKMRQLAATDRKILSDAERSRAAEALSIAATMGRKKRGDRHEQEQALPRPQQPDSGSCAEQTSLYAMGADNGPDAPSVQGLPGTTGIGM